MGARKGWSRENVFRTFSMFSIFQFAKINTSTSAPKTPRGEAVPSVEPSPAARAAPCRRSRHVRHAAADAEPERVDPRAPGREPKTTARPGRPRGGPRPRPRPGPGLLPRRARAPRRRALGPTPAFSPGAPRTPPRVPRAPARGAAAGAHPPPRNPGRGPRRDNTNPTAQKQLAHGKLIFSGIGLKKVFARPSSFARPSAPPR